MGVIRNILDWLFRRNQPTPPPQPPVPPVVPPTPPEPLPSDPLEAIKQRLLELHNHQRTARNLAPFNRRVELDASAQGHNDYMVARQNLTHNEPGRDIGKRVSEAGYSWRTVGGNIAMGQRTPEEVVNGWMNSSGHRANILNGSFRDIGFGVTQDGRGVWWWTTNFGG